MPSNSIYFKFYSTLIWIFLIYQFTINCNRLEKLKTFEDFYHLCMLGRKHKTVSTPEVGLNGTCSAWRDRSCCKMDVDYEYNAKRTAHGFTYNHCPGKPMSDKCLRHFRQDLCFYECSPNLGPWLVKETGMKMREERFFGAPLCVSDCEAWWQDCRLEHTCVANWMRGFKWINGRNTCPNNGNTCRTFERVYGSARYFCETIWGGSWRVESGPQCLHVPSTDQNRQSTLHLINNNMLVMHHAAYRIATGNGAASITVSLALLLPLITAFQ